MADPITWGLINLVRKGIKGVQTAIDGVGDTVSELPASLETDFTEVKNEISGVKEDVGNVNTAVSGVKNDTSSIKNTVDTNPLLSAGSVVKSVQRGTKVNFSASNGTQVTTISPVNLSKSVLIVNSVYNSNDSSTQSSGFYLSNANTISCAANNGARYVSIAWQVIEFY